MLHTSATQVINLYRLGYSVSLWHNSRYSTPIMQHLQTLRCGCTTWLKITTESRYLALGCSNAKGCTISRKFVAASSNRSVNERTYQRSITIICIKGACCYIRILLFNVPLSYLIRAINQTWLTCCIIVSSSSETDGVAIH